MCNSLAELLKSGAYLNPEQESKPQQEEVSVIQNLIQQATTLQPLSEILTKKTDYAPNFFGILGGLLSDIDKLEQAQFEAQDEYQFCIENPYYDPNDDDYDYGAKDALQYQNKIIDALSERLKIANQLVLDYAKDLSN